MIDFRGQDDETLYALRSQAENELSNIQSRAAELQHIIRQITREQDKRFRDYIEGRLASLDNRTAGSIMVGGRIR